MKQPTKAIICAAGLGTRFLPQTKAMPKEMLPIIDRPVIQLIVEEAIAAGVTDIIIVTGTTKRAIEDHFDRSEELEIELREKGKDDKADEIKAISEMANFVYIRQKGTPKGNARPILNAQHMIDDDEPFFVFFADDFFRSKVPRAVQLKRAHEKTGKSVISLIEIERSDADKYGMAAIGDDLGDRTFRVDELIEKPGEADTPSNFASVGGYLLTPDILPIIAQEKVGKGGEITLAESINELAQTDSVYGQFIEGVWHDTGDQLKYIKAVVDMALENELYAADFATYLRKRL
ncbi:MAG TPA: UTP--glucose-1-phosphate uridylyltransferase [Candidatus Saccharimonadales bacterium]|jgi:UTP--glucose-1-phosphate uridylyltransferase|nr:UTP--glucose-1-phosphate uridylyltransferase [Candidatus Saccharimonadales bacterium]